MPKTSFVSTILLLIFGLNNSWAQPDITVEEFATGFTIPVDITNAGDERLFIVEKLGDIRIIDEDGTTLPTPFLSIGGRVNAGANERGLLGLTFHPNYTENGYFYVNYTNFGGSTIISRFSRSEDNPNLADPSSEKIIMTIQQPFNNHNGGDLNFGPDGYLYIGMGDGGNAGDPGNRAQNNQTLLGKILRIDVNTADDIAYTIPENNPFVDDSNVLDEIWSIGWRNPWRFTFDSSTGDMWVGDVGQNKSEEISFQPASSKGGENYGWKCYEGDQPFRTSGCPSIENFVAPIYAYAHRTDDGCGGSVTGGEVYRGSRYPGLSGYYIYADYCSGTISAILQNQFGGFDNFDLTVIGNNTISTFGKGNDETIYMANVQTGTIFAIRGQEVSSTKEAIQFESFNIAPNPFKDQLAIQFETQQKGDFRLLVSDLNGRKIYESQEQFVPFFTKTIDLKNIPTGVYLLQIETGQQLSSWRVLRQD